MTAFEAYQLFLAIRMHFTQKSYDYIKYNGKVPNLNFNKFDSRRDKYFFDKLAKRPNAELRCASNMFHSTSRWITDVVSDEGTKIYQQRQKAVDSLSYVINNDLEQYDTMDDAFAVYKQQKYPNILQRYFHDEIYPETMIVVEATCCVFDYWSRALNDEYVWPKERDRLVAYATFVKFDQTKYRELVVDIFN